MGYLKNKEVFLCHLKDREVFFVMKKLFNQLYQGEINFKKVFDSFGKVTLKVSDIENLIFYIEETGQIIRLGGYDWNIAINFPISMKFTEVFLYEKESAFLYSGGIVADEDKVDLGSNYYTIEFNFDYPEMDEVLIKEGNASEWKRIKGVPSVFKEIVNSLGLSSYDNSNLIKIYNTPKDRYLVIDIMSASYGIIDRYTYGDNDKVDFYIEEIIKSVDYLEVPISDIFIFSLGDLSSARLKKNWTGEYTLVIE